MIITEEHKLIRNLGSDLSFVRKVINKSFFFLNKGMKVVSSAAAQLVSWEMWWEQSSMWVQADQQAVPHGAPLIHMHCSGAGQRCVQPKLCFPVARPSPP